jgi:hypothetical protein
MPRTPDRSPGEEDEEGTIYENLTPGNDPTVVGGVRMVNGVFRLKDSVSVFDPHIHNTQHYVGGEQPIIAQSTSSGSATAGQVMQATGAGAWNLVSVVAGVAAELNRANDTVLSTTTSATFITKLTLTTTSLPVGDYILFWSYITNGSNNNTQVESRVRKDGTTDLFLVVNKASTAGSQFSNSGHDVQVALSGVHTFTIDYRFAGGAGSAGIQGVHLTLWLIDN